MLYTKRIFSIVKMLAFLMVFSVSACETKTEKKVETSPVIVKDTVRTFDTTATARPRQPGS